MTNQEAIKMQEAIKAGLKETGKDHPYRDALIPPMKESCDMAIEALKVQSEPQTARVFQEIVVEYPSISAYPEYKGKPYFSIKYTENGQGFIGYGTYKPEVLSEYLKEYFMPPAQPERPKGHWVFDFAHNEMTCSECGRTFTGGFDLENADNFCRHCGSDMR